ncbi:hypothetical protein DVA81_18410, partial [Acinetobacter baumannii]
MPGQMQDTAAVNYAPPERYLEPAEPASGSGRGQARHSPYASSLTNSESSAATEQLLVKADDEDVIIISSSSDNL